MKSSPTPRANRLRRLSVSASGEFIGDSEPGSSAAEETPLEALLFELRQRKSVPWGMFAANMSSALDALWTNRTRSLLTALGIFIGVAAVIAALTLTQGATAQVNAEIATLGSNMITIVPAVAERAARQLGSSERSLTVKDVADLEKVQNVSGVSPVTFMRGVVVYNNQNWQTMVQGVSTDFQNLQNWKVASGAWFTKTDDDSRRPVALIGQTVARNLFDASGIDPLGQTIRIRDQLFKVVGILEPKGNSFGQDQDDIIIVPIKSAQDRFNTTSRALAYILVQANALENVDQVQQSVVATLRRNHPVPQGQEDVFETFTSEQILEEAQLSTSLLTALIVGIAAISLTVGGIGIMNIMLVSVTERTREIGIRMASGARRADIRNQFLIEALLLCLVGGLVGLGLGLLIGRTVVNFLNFPFVITPTTLILPFAVSAGIGIVFGLYPAIRASRLDPIVALRRTK